MKVYQPITGETYLHPITSYEVQTSDEDFKYPEYPKLPPGHWPTRVLDYSFAYIGEWFTSKGVTPDYITKVVEALIIFVRTLYRARDTTDVVDAIFNVIHALRSDSLVTSFQQLQDTIGAFMLPLFEGPEVQSGDYVNPFTKLRELLEAKDEFVNSVFAQKIRKVFYYILSFSILEPMGITFDTFNFNRAAAEAETRKHSSQLGFMMCVLDGFTYVSERLYDVYKTRNWNSILCSGKSYRQWVDDVYKVKEDSQKLSNPEACGFTHHEFLGRLESALERGDGILRHATSSGQKRSSDADVVKRLQAELRLIKAQECTRSRAQATRCTPFGISLFGGSSIGKSGITDMIMTYVGTSRDLPLGEEYKYTRIFSDDFWSGFRSQCWFIVLDEVAAKVHGDGVDNSMNEIQSILNTVSYTPPQAELADKGRIPCVPDVVVATTNVRNLNAHLKYNNTLAVMRRFKMHVHVIPKPEFGRGDSDMTRVLDLSNAPPLKSGEYPNYWTFKVSRAIADVSCEKQIFKFSDEVIIDDINEFLKLVALESKAFHEAELEYLSGQRSYRDIPICKACFTVTSRCECVHETDIADDIEVDSSMFDFSDLDTILAEEEEIPLLDAVSEDPDYIPVKKYVKAVSFAEPLERPGLPSDTMSKRFCSQCRKKCANCNCVQSIDSVESAVEAVVFCGVLYACIKLFGHYFCDLIVDVVKRYIAYKRTSFLDEVRANCMRMRMSVSQQIEYERDTIRTRMGAFGDSLAASARKHSYLLQALAMIATISSCAFMVKKFENLDFQGLSQEVGERIVTQDEKPNPWHRDDYEPATFETGRLTKSWKSLDATDAIDKISRNVIFIETVRTSPDGKVTCRPGRALCLGGQLYVTNNHNIPEDAETLSISIVQNTVVKGITGNITFVTTQSCLRRFPERDLVFFEITNLPPKKDLQELIVADSFTTVCTGFYITRGKTGSTNAWQLRAVRKEDVYIGIFRKTMPSWKADCAHVTEKGDCGTTMLGMTPLGPAILGLHQTGGLTNSVTAVRITMEIVEEAKKYFRPIVQGSCPHLAMEDGSMVVVQPIHQKSVARFIEDGQANVYGSLDCKRSGNKSKVTRTYIYRSVRDRGYEDNFDKPYMSGWQPWRKGALDIVQQKFTMRDDILQECVQSFAKDILKMIPKEQLKELVILDNLSTINGLPGVKFIDKMNRNTSMGYPWSKKKKYLLDYKGEFDLWQDCVDFDELFYARVDTILGKYQAGERVMPLFVGHLKDEPTSQAKIESMATRVFAGAPADWSFVVRKYLLSYVRLSQNNRFAFEAAPGTNATSMEWDDIYHYLTSHGKDRMVAGDYSKFDKNMCAQVILAAFDVIILILQAAGWKEEELKVIRGISFDVAFPLVNFNGDLIEFFGSNPSGQPLTVTINSLVNSLYLRYAWKLAGNDLGSFKNQVSVMTYGDDNIMGIDKSVTNFNHTILQTSLATIGVKYTMADKLAESVPFIHISQASFLKRAWRFEPDLQSHVAILDHSSIGKMLTKHIPGQVLCIEQHSVEVMQTALMEYFFYGKEEFMKRRKMMLEIVDENELQPYMTRDFPVWDDMITKYKEDSDHRVCKLCSGN